MLKIKFIFKIIPVPIIITDNLPENFAGLSHGLFIKIRPEYQNDEGLIQHELTHCKQFWKYGWIGYSLLYKFSDKWRLKFEAEAYSVQLSYCKDKSVIDILAKRLETLYSLNITHEEAIKAIQKRG